MNRIKAVKLEHIGDIVLFRLGDFYECFDEDAIIVSNILSVKLIKNMCGVHKKELINIISKITANHYNVVVYEYARDFEIYVSKKLLIPFEFVKYFKKW